MVVISYLVLSRDYNQKLVSLQLLLPLTFCNRSKKQSIYKCKPIFKFLYSIILDYELSNCKLSVTVGAFLATYSIFLFVPVTLCILCYHYANKILKLINF